MRGRGTGFVLALLVLLASAPGAEAKKFRYSSGPKAPEDSALTVANPYLDPIVRSRGPRVPYTNLQLLEMVADTAADKALATLPLESSTHAVLAPAREHPLNFVFEHALLNALTARGVSITLRHSPVPDDSVATLFGAAGEPLVEYTVGSARITYLRLVGWLPGRVKVERQALVQGSLSLRESSTSRVLWTHDLRQNFLDRVPRGQISMVEEARLPDLKDDVPGRNVDKALEPIIVVAVVGGLVALFFQNRP